MNTLSFQAKCLIEASLDPLAVISKTGVISAVNQAYIKLIGRSSTEIIGKPYANYFTDPLPFSDIYKSIITEGPINNQAFVVKNKQGALTNVLLNGSCYINNNNVVEGIIMVARDVTAQKTAYEYARNLIEASRDPLFTINTEGKITDINLASVNITGVARAQLIDTDFFNYFTEPQNARLAYQSVFANGFVADYPLTISDQNLTEVLLNGSVYKDPDGNVAGIVVVARDFTEQKAIEKELIEARVFAELATFIAEEAKEKAEAAVGIAEEAVKTKQQFLSNMSHEIRTPMNAIIGFARVLLKTEITEKQKEYLNAIKLSGDALIVLINDILDLAKVDAGKMSFEVIPFKLKNSINTMLHLFEVKILEKNLELIPIYDQHIPDILEGDSLRLNQILLNLMSNAVKFTNKGSITMEVKLINETQQSVDIKFSIKDTGVGIAEENIGKIFENFQQATSGTSRIFGGTGLGLAIVKQLVELQGGEINVVSELGQGSEFSFILNFIKTDNHAIIEDLPFEINHEHKNIKVLVVEDIPINQLLMRTLLDDFGFEKEIASNGLIAIEKLNTKAFDIILMDLQMPEMNGFEATTYIRNILKSNIPIIALTADVTTVDLEKCTAVGMNDYITKPVDEKVLYNKILSFTKKDLAITTLAELKNTEIIAEQKRITNLDYLHKIAKSDHVIMMDMINLYLNQTPTLIQTIKESLASSNWESLKIAAHKIMPSFYIMGFNKKFETIAVKIQKYAENQVKEEDIDHLVQQLETACQTACLELNETQAQLKQNLS